MVYSRVVPAVEGVPEFTEPMLLAPSEALPDDPEWAYRALQRPVSS